MVPDAQALLLTLGQGEDLLQLEAAQALGVDFVHFYPLGVELVELEDVAVEGALAGQILKPLVEVFLQVTVGHYLVYQGPVVLPELLLVRIAVH